MKLKDFEGMSEDEKEVAIERLENRAFLAPEEREILRRYWTNVRSIKSVEFMCRCGRYQVDADLMSDGESPDESNTSICITKVE